MRRSSLIAATVLTLALAPAGLLAQQENQPVPDAPQPQKKPAAKPAANSGSTPDQKDAQPQSSNDKDTAKPSSGKDDNPFPEDVSKAAAAKSSGQSTDPGSGQSNSSGAAKDGGKGSTAADNPFPEAESKAAAKAAGNDSEPAAPAGHDLPPGVSSSRSSGVEDGEADISGKVEPNPDRAKKDTEVGGFYLKSGDYKGALQRFQDATTYDPTNVEAIFGLAETQRMLKKNADAARNYQLYLDILPNGPRSRQALKALKTLSSGG
jgi:tetratricopeptide (TPR) repeat protein